MILNNSTSKKQGLLSEAKRSTEKNSKKGSIETEESLWQELSHHTCPKLTPRGQGEISYTLGIKQPKNAECGETSDTLPILGLKMTGSGSKGTFSREWIYLDKIKLLLEPKEEGIIKGCDLLPLFEKQSNNNTGYLLAILRSLGVIIPIQGVLSHFKYSKSSLDALYERMKNSISKAEEENKKGRKELQEKKKSKKKESE